MSIIRSLQRWLSKDWFAALVVLGIYLATNRYVYAWDDQHLEIPLLKHLIDPELYKGDYYVESLAQNFTSYLYPILSKIITVAQIPAAYLVLFLISRYFLFYWSFKLWDLLARKYFGDDPAFPSRFAAFCAAVMLIVIGRTEEFLYRTFSHQEFALGIIAAAIYYFFKDRYFLSALLFGIAADFHALYALFPMTYMSVYLLFFHKEKRLSLFIKTGLIFVVGCLPFLLWAIPKNIALHAQMPADLTKDWIEMYYLACPQNYPFGADRVPAVLADYKLLALNMAPYFLMAALYAFHFIFNPPFRRDWKIHAIALTALGYVAACFYLAYGHPMRFAMDLNLIRNEQYLRFFMMGYTSIFVFKKVREAEISSAIFLSVLLMCLWFRGPLGVAIASMAILFVAALEWKNLLGTWPKWKLWTVTAFVAAVFALAVPGINWPKIRMDKVTVDALAVAALVLYSFWEFRSRRKFRSIFVVAPLVLAIIFFCYYHYQYVQVTTKGGGFWQLQRNWEEMQQYVRDHTPKDALIMTPYNTEMGGFRIGSERKLLVSYRDCGIVGFDYKAALEWQQRVKDIESFKVFVDPTTIGPAIVSGLYKYKVDYIVFMRYYAPEDNPLVKKMYENEVFALYKVTAPRE